MPESAQNETKEPHCLSTIIEVLHWRAERQPDRIAYTYLVDGEEEEQHLTYGELDQQARAIAERLDKLKNEHNGSCSAVLMYQPGLEFIVAFCGCLYAGIIAVPLYPPKPNRSIAHLKAVVRDAEPFIALTSSSESARLSQILSNEVDLHTLPLFATDTVGKNEHSEWQPKNVGANDLALLQYTSGSTADPKGVMVLHRNIMANERAIQIGCNADESLVTVSWLPMFHDMGLFAGTLLSLYTGGKSVLMAPISFLERPLRWLEAVMRHKGSCIIGPNFGYELCVTAGSQGTDLNLDLSSLHMAWNGAEPVRAEVMDKFYDVFSPYGFQQNVLGPCYGLAEATVMVTGSKRNLPPQVMTLDSASLDKGFISQCHGNNGQKNKKVVGCGICYDETSVTIVDPKTMVRSPLDRVGEIWLSGPGVAKGYWNHPKETEYTFNAHLADTKEGPFLRTGDLGFIHNGELFVTGRLKDLIIIRGRNIYPQDIEGIVEKELLSPQPNPSAAFSIEVQGRENIAVVVAADRALGRTIAKAEKANKAKSSRLIVPELEVLIGKIRRSVTNEFDVTPHTVAFVRRNSFPKTSSGKVQRALCRSLLLSGGFEILYESRLDTAIPSVNQLSFNPTDLRPAIHDSVVEWLRSNLNSPADRIDYDAEFATLGVDSLGAVTIALAIEERTGFRCTVDIIYDNQSVNALAKYLETYATPAEKGEIKAPCQQSSVQACLRKALSNQNPLDRYVQLNARLYKMEQEGRYFFAPEITEQSNARILADGKRMMVMGSYGYLGLLKHPELNEAAHRAIDEFGTGHHGVRLLAGTTVLHRNLERFIAEFFRGEDAIVYSSGYVTNLATIGALVGPGDCIIGDEWNHASIIDGCKFSGAVFFEYKHNDMDSLREKLERANGAHTLVVVDGVFSMEGDIAKLPEIVDLCCKYKALLMVDEAHSIGVLGKFGRGIQEHFDLPADAIDIKMGTLSKALGSSGGFVAAKEPVIKYLRHHARGYIFSGALPVAEIAAAHTALKVLAREPDRVDRIRRNADRYRNGLKALGFHTFGSVTAIVPVACKTEHVTLEMVRICRDNGLFVVPVFYPAVPMNAPRLRTCVMASHTDEDIDFALDVLAKAGRETGLIS
jgi:8-amino-7-oxononanoate synthase